MKVTIIKVIHDWNPLRATYLARICDNEERNGRIKIVSDITEFLASCFFDEDEEILKCEFYRIEENSFKCNDDEEDVQIACENLYERCIANFVRDNKYFNTLLEKSELVFKRRK